MTQLNAKTKKIKEIFQQEYVIPEYQRRYSWDKEQCLQLVEDLHAFHEASEERDNDQYFLGCIVVAKCKKNTWDVIDGQQRLMTISLLIRALLNKIVNYADLQRCLQKTDPKSGKFKNELHLTSNVVDDDNKNLKEILLGNDTAKENRFSENYENLKQAVDGMNLDSELDKFVETLLEKAVLLPIECDSVETALTIFQTLNDRGMQLTDADIFKAVLYGGLSTKKEKKQFIQEWNDLQEQAENYNESIDQAFRIYMHILRAKAKDIAKEIKLRTYFSKKSKRLSNPTEVMHYLQTCQSVYDWESCDIITIWWVIIESYPNIYWQYPVYVFLIKHGNYDGEEFSISKQKEKEFIQLLKDTIRYCYIKGVVTNSVNTIKDTIFKVCRAIEHGEDYEGFYQDNASADMDTFMKKLTSSEYGRRYQKGLVLISSALHLSQKRKEHRAAYSNTLLEKYDIEHILPREWNHYDGWDYISHADDIDKLGNLIPIEKKLNIKASNEFFAKKKEKGYKNSKIAEVKELSNKRKWTRQSLQKRQKDVLGRLKEFFDYY